MAATVTSRIQLILSALLQDTVGVAAAQGKVEPSDILFNLASGTGANQANKLYSGQITRTSGAPTGDLDFAGVLTDPLGNVITATKVKALVFFAAAANINTVVIGGGAPATAVSTIFFDYVATALAQPAMHIRPGGLLVLVAPDATGYGITAATADKLQVANGDQDGTTSVTVNVYAIAVG